MKTLPKALSETVRLFRLRLDFRWLRLFHQGIWIEIVAVENRPTEFFRQFFACLNPDQTLGIAKSAIKFDVADIIYSCDIT